MNRKDYLKKIGLGSLGLAGGLLTARNSFAAEPMSKGIIKCDDDIILNANDIIQNHKDIGNVSDFQTIFTGDGEKPTNCVDAISQINSNLLFPYMVLGVTTKCFLLT